MVYPNTRTLSWSRLKGYVLLNYHRDDSNFTLLLADEILIHYFPIPTEYSNDFDHFLEKNIGNKISSAFTGVEITYAEKEKMLITHYFIKFSDNEFEFKIVGTNRHHLFLNYSFCSPNRFNTFLKITKL